MYAISIYIYIYTCIYIGFRVYRSFVTDEDYGQLKLKINGTAIDLHLRYFVGCAFGSKS